MARYLSILLGIPGVLLTLMAAINTIIDPFDIYRVVTVDGFNAQKTELPAEGARVSVSFDVLRGAYPVAFFGNSRVQSTIPSEIAGLPAPVLNAGMANVTGLELAKAVRLVPLNGGVRCVFIGLEYEEFATLGRVRGAYWLSAFPDGSSSLAKLRTAFSFTTFNRAVQTVAANLAGRTAARPEAIVVPSHQHDAFVVSAREAFARFRNFEYDAQRVTILGRTITRLASHGVQVFGFLSPIHAWNEEALWQAGHGPDSLRLRRDLVEIFAQAAAYPSSAPCAKGKSASLWDFGGFQPISVSPVPMSGAASAQPYYREAMHYTRAVSIALARRIVGLDNGLGVSNTDFGIEITRENIDADLAAIAHRRDHWLASSPDASALLALVSKWRQTDSADPSTERYYLTASDLAQF